jgi:ribosome-binding protein aMBF1 (putative translation factor)
MAVCKLCGDKTVNVFNIKLNKIPVCEECATAIFIQQAHFYVEKKYEIVPEKKPKDE